MRRDQARRVGGSHGQGRCRQPCEPYSCEFNVLCTSNRVLLFGAPGAAPGLRGVGPPPARAGVIAVGGGLVKNKNGRSKPPRRLMIRPTYVVQDGYEVV